MAACARKVQEFISCSVHKTGCLIWSPVDAGFLKVYILPDRISLKVYFLMPVKERMC